MDNTPKVMISSTIRDLPRHREQVSAALNRLGMFPKMMEHLPASDDKATKVSLDMVDGADIYLGIFAFRYGYVPVGHDLSLTEMEYNRAVERGIPCLIFLMHDEHPLRAADVERGAGANKLDTFKERLKTAHVCRFFKSPADLRAEVLSSLMRWANHDLSLLHRVSDIPELPTPYIPHPYMLLQTASLIGRRTELNFLTDWVAKPTEPVYQARVVSIVALGGMGKSALTWKWFNSIAPLEMRPLAGRMWWSFYESDANYENFITRALAYVSQRPVDEITNLAFAQREAELLAVLDSRPFLLVMDGLERLLVAYTHMDAASLADDEYDMRTGNAIPSHGGLEEEGARMYYPSKDQQRLRKTIDPRVGNFLRKLASVKQSRILVSTRLYPADLQTSMGNPFAGTYNYHLEGLTDDDAIELWRSSGVSGGREQLLRLFNSFGKYPLLIHALAKEIQNYHRAPCDFEQWRQDNPDFDPFHLPLVQTKTEVLHFALRGLSNRSEQVLQTLAAFRLPAAYGTLEALLVGEGKPAPNVVVLDQVLSELEERALLGWDRLANRYDIHPVIRGVVLSRLSEEAKQGVYQTLHAHFESLPKVTDWKKVKHVDELTASIENFHALTKLKRYDEAIDFFRNSGQLHDALSKLAAGRHLIELMQMLLPNDQDQLPPVEGWYRKGLVFRNLAIGYGISGNPRQAQLLFRRVLQMSEEAGDIERISTHLRLLVEQLILCGLLYDAEHQARRALAIARGQKEDGSTKEAQALRWLGFVLAMRGETTDAEAAFERALRLFESIRQRVPSFNRSIATINNCRAQHALWLQDFATARQLAEEAWKIAQIHDFTSDLVLSARIQGEAALGLGDWKNAEHHLNYSVQQVRSVVLVQEELPALVALAELRRQQGDLDGARRLLDDVWKPAENGQYPWFHVDALNVRTRIEHDAGRFAAAIRAATEAYQLAWREGPSFAYHWGLQMATQHLQVLSAEVPEMPPFDDSKHEPMPEVEIDPPNTFYPS